MDPVTGSFVLDQPGEYDFFVVNHPDPRDPKIEQRSNLLTVRVEEVPTVHRESYEAYRALGLGGFVDSPAQHTRDTNRIEAARGFLDEHPAGPYHEAVQKAYVEVLGYRVTAMIATKEEQTLYFKLMGLDKESIEAQRQRER